MMTPQGWTKHAPGTYSVNAPQELPTDYPALIDIQDLKEPVSQPQPRSATK